MAYASSWAQAIGKWRIQWHASYRWWDAWMASTVTTKSIAITSKTIFQIRSLRCRLARFAFRRSSCAGEKCSVLAIYYPWTAICRCFFCKRISNGKPITSEIMATICDCVMPKATIRYELVKARKKRSTLYKLMYTKNNRPSGQLRLRNCQSNMKMPKLAIISYTGMGV